MATLQRAGTFIRRHPVEAATDLAGFLAVCGLIAFGFLAPALF